MEVSKNRRRSLCYSLDQTILINIETDTQFLYDIRQIAEKKQVHEMPQFQQKNEIKDQQLQEINQKALRHQQANIFNKTSMLNIGKIDKSEICQCGCQRGVGQKFPLHINQQNLHFLGPGVLLFFFYLRQVRILVAIVFLVYGIFALTTNLLASQNEVISCQNNFFYSQIICSFNGKSTFDKKNNIPILVYVQLWLGFIGCLFWSLGIRFVLYLGQQADHRIDELLDSAADYTIRIQNLPYGQYHEQQLIDYLYQLWSQSKSSGNSQMSIQPDLKLKSIQIVYNTSKCRKLIGQIIQQSGQLLKLLKTTTFKFSNTVKEDQVNNYRKQKKSLVQKLRQLQQIRCNFLNNSDYRKILATTCTLVEFVSSDQQKQFVRLFGTSRNPLQQVILPTKNFSFKGYDVDISRAPEPSDMNWINCQKKFSYFTYFVIWVMTFIILGVGYGFISVLQTIDIFTSSNVTLVAITLQLVNRAIWLTLGYLVTYQQNNTKTDAIVSLMKRSVIAQAINVIIAPIVTQFINNKPLYGNKGLSSIIFQYHIGMFVTLLLYYILNPFYLGKKLLLSIKFSRNIIIKQLSQIVDKIQNYEQIQKVLQLYEGPELPLAGGYVYMTTAIFHAMFYCHLQPSILLVAIFNMSIFLIMMKYMLFKRCKIPELTDIQVFRFAVFAIGFGPMFYGAGSLLFMYLDDRNLDILQCIPSILCILVWFISTINLFSLPESILHYILKYVNALPENNKRVKVRAQSIGQSIFFNQDFFENKFWRRRQSYYSNCNTGKLLDFERQLKDKDLDKGIQSASVRNYSQNFFKNQVIFDWQETGDVSPDEQYLNNRENILIPIQLIEQQVQQ